MTTFQSIREFRCFMAKILHRFLAQKVLVCLVIALRLTVTAALTRRWRSGTSRRWTRPS